MNTDDLSNQTLNFVVNTILINTVLCLLENLMNLMLNTYSYHGEFFVKRETPTVINLEALPHLELSTSIFSILL